MPSITCALISLDCHTRTNAGSFQRALSFSLRCCATLRSSGSDPASGRDGLESNQPRRFWRPPRHPWNIRPCIGGFRLYTLRRAQPLSKCRHTGAGHSCRRFRLHDRRASCPFSGAVRCCRLTGIVSFHSQLRGLWNALSNARKGRCCRMEGATLRPGGLMRSCGVCTPASAGVEEEIEEANGSAGAYAPTLPLSHRWHFNFHRYVNTTKFFMR